MKKALIVAGIIVAIPVIILVWFFIESSGIFTSTPSRPEITYSEFPFVLEYEIDGEYHKVQDTLVCEFTGFEFVLGLAEKRRMWDAHLKSGNKQITLLQQDNIEILYFPVTPNSGEAKRLAGVFMGDSDFTGGTNSTFPDALYKVLSQENLSQNAYLITADDLLSQYKIRLISWECAPPIENRFNKS